jgi:LEA14-like dessication related protein
VGDRGPEAVQLVFDVRLANPNTRTLELEELTYTLSIDGRRVFEGRRAAGCNLASVGEQQITVPAVVPAAAVEGASTCALRGSLRYRTPGQLAQRLFDTGVRRPRTRFRYDGPVALD